MKKMYITKDGKQFENKLEAETYEKNIKTLSFFTREKALEFLKNTEIFKKWEKEKENMNVLTLDKEIRELVKELKEEYSRVFVDGESRPVDLEILIGNEYLSDAIVVHFKEQTRLEYPDEKIVELYNYAFSENHSYGLIDTLGEFDKYIYALEIMHK